MGEWARGAGGVGVGGVIATAGLKLSHGLLSFPIEEREKRIMTERSGCPDFSFPGLNPHSHLSSYPSLSSDHRSHPPGFSVSILLSSYLKATGSLGSNGRLPQRKIRYVLWDQRGNRRLSLLLRTGGKKFTWMLSNEPLSFRLNLAIPKSSQTCVPYLSKADGILILLLHVVISND